MGQPRKIAICHYRVGNTDGVSLETKKRKQILEKQGCEVKLIAGPRSKGADYIINELEWEDGAISEIKQNGFADFQKRDFNSEELKNKVLNTSNIIESKLDKICQKENFDNFLVHNIFCFGGHVSAAKAFYNIIETYQIPTIATHHDFYWERKDYRVPAKEFLQEYVDNYLPPKSGYITHVVLNSLTKKRLKKKKNIEATVMPDIFDFSQTPVERDKFNKNFLETIKVKPNDLFVLQATRILPRKGIELAVELVAELQKNIETLQGEILYNGKHITKDSKVVLVLAGYWEKSNKEYYLRIKELAQDKGIEIRFICDLIKSKRAYRDRTRTFSLWDSYVFADLVTYPSLWEGWGNQFIEAVFYRKPIVVWEYPVFKKDIKSEGYKVISLGDEVSLSQEGGLNQLPHKQLDKAVKTSQKFLTDPNLDKVLDKNFNIGKKNHDFPVLEDFLKKELNL